MVAPLSKIIRRLSGFSIGDKPLVVSLLPGGIIHLKPHSTSRAEEASIDALALYEQLRAPSAPPAEEKATEKPGEPLSNYAVLQRLRERVPTVLAPEEGETGRESYLTSVRVLALVRLLEEEFAEEARGPE